MKNSEEETVNRIQFTPFNQQTLPKSEYTAKLEAQQPQPKPLGKPGLQRVSLEPGYTAKLEAQQPQPKPLGKPGLQRVSLEPGYTAKLEAQQPQPKPLGKPEFQRVSLEPGYTAKLEAQQPQPKPLGKPEFQRVSLEPGYTAKLEAQQPQPKPLGKPEFQRVSLEPGYTARLEAQQPQPKPLGKPELQRVSLEPGYTAKLEAQQPQPKPLGKPELQRVSPEPIPAGWPELMTKYIGIIPQPIYLLLLAVIIGFVFIGKVPTEISMVVAIMALCGFTLAEIGKRLPILRDIGAPAMIALLAPSYLVFQHLLPTSLVKVVSNSFNSTNILSLFIAVMIVGGILSMERNILIGGFLKVFAPMLAGTILAAVVGLLVGMALGLGAYHTFFFIVVPIMGGGLAEGAIPLSIGYHQILHQDQQTLLAQIIPAVLVGNLVATLMAGLLNYIGKKAPELTGEGNLEPGKHDKLTASQDKSHRYIDSHHIAAVGITAITLYLLGNLCASLFGIPGLIVMITLAIALKLAYMISPDLQHGASHLQEFFAHNITLPILFAASISLIQWNQLVAGFALPNLITGTVVVITLMGTGFIVGRLVRLYPVEAAVINLCHGGMGGIGDLIILSAANRMKLMPFSQIATRIGGVIVVSLALLLLARIL